MTCPSNLYMRSFRVKLEAFERGTARVRREHEGEQWWRANHGGRFCESGATHGARGTRSEAKEGWVEPQLPSSNPSLARPGPAQPGRVRAPPPCYDERSFLRAGQRDEKYGERGNYTSVYKLTSHPSNIKTWLSIHLLPIHLKWSRWNSWMQDIIIFRLYTYSHHMSMAFVLYFVFVCYIDLNP